MLAASVGSVDSQGGDQSKKSLTIGDLLVKVWSFMPCPGLVVMLTRTADSTRMQVSFTVFGVAQEHACD